MVNGLPNLPILIQSISSLTHQMFACCNRSRRHRHTRISGDLTQSKANGSILDDAPIRLGEEFILEFGSSPDAAGYFSEPQLVISEGPEESRKRARVVAHPISRFGMRAAQVGRIEGHPSDCKWTLRLGGWNPFATIENKRVFPPSTFLA